MKKTFSILIVLSLLVTPAYACFESSSWTEADGYFAKTGQKLCFGVKNLALGILDIFYEPHRAQSEGNSVALGILKGWSDAVFNIVEGALHIVTFPIPLDIPLPDGGVDFSIP